MTINWQNGLVNSGFDAIAAFNAGRTARTQENELRRTAAARQAETDYFTARHTPGISSATVDRGTETGLPMGGSGALAGASGPIGRPMPNATSQTEALIRLAQADPSRAFALEDRERKSRSEDLDIMHKLNAASGRLLAGVSDQASYDSAMSRMKKMFARYGANMDDHEVPATYDSDYVQNLRMSALDIDKQLAAERGAKRLEWDIEDDQVDNERADRNTDSAIADRTARRDITVRGQNLSDARGRRAQDIASSDRRRGQDIVGKRGPARTARGSGSNGAGTARSPVSVTIPAEAAALKVGTYYRTPDGRVKLR